MPKIPIFKRRVRPIGGGGIPGVDRPATGLVSRQIEQTGETLLALGEKLDDARRNTFVAESLTTAKMAFENRLEEYRQDPDFWSHPADAEKFADEQVATVMGSARDKLTEQVLRSSNLQFWADNFKRETRRENWDRQIIYSKTADVGVMENLLEGWPKANAIERKAMSDWLQDYLTRQAEAGIYHAWEAAAKYQGFIHGAEALRAREDMIGDPEGVFVGINKGEYDLDEKRKVYLSDMAARRATAQDAKVARFLEKQERDAEKELKESREFVADSAWNLFYAGDLTKGVVQKLHDTRSLPYKTAPALFKALEGEEEEEDIHVFNYLRNKIDQGIDSREEINRAVEQGTISQVGTISSLHSRNYQIQNEEGVYGTPDYDNAKSWLKRQGQISGVGAELLYPGEAPRQADMDRHYERLISEGVDPWDAADEVARLYPVPHIKEVPLSMMRLPFYGPGKIETMEDVDEAKKLLAAARHKKQITAEKYNEEYLHIEKLETAVKIEIARKKTSEESSKKSGSKWRQQRR